MEIEEAIKIIKAVADGVNPFTGEVFPKDSVYQHPQMVRALYRAVASLEARQKWEKRQKELPEKAGKPWTDEEDRQLAEAFDSGMKIHELARKHKRTRTAIELRLEKMGKIELSPEKRRIAEK